MRVFRETGSVHHKKGVGRPTLCTNEDMEDVEEPMENNPSTSLRHLLQEVGLSVGICHKIVKKKFQFFPYELHAYHWPTADGFLNNSLMITCWI